MFRVVFGGGRIAAVKARRKRRTFTAAIIAAWDSRQIKSAISKPLRSIVGAYMVGAVSTHKVNFYIKNYWTYNVV